MNLPEISIRHAVFTVMISVLIVLVGVVSILKLGIQANPNVKRPVISVTTKLYGANPKIIHKDITKPIEHTLNTISGLKTISSNSTAGRSNVELQFHLNKDINVAYNEVQQKLSPLVEVFPKGTKPVEIRRVSQKDSPIMEIVLYGDRTLGELVHFSKKNLVPLLQRVEGVSLVRVDSTANLNININLNIKKMASYKINTSDIKNALVRENINVPSRAWVDKEARYNLDLNLKLKGVKALKELVIASRLGSPIRLKDIASIDVGNRRDAVPGYFNGKNAVGISIIKQNTANTVTVVHTIKQILNTTIKPALASGVHLEVLYENASFIQTIVNGLFQDIWLAILVAGIIIIIFLQSIRSTGIIIVTIPISLLGAVVAMYAVDYTFNIVTLLALILLVGIVVDDGIVMLENINRHIQDKKSNIQDAVTKGASEVTFAVLASSLSIVCIFGPIIFMAGIIGLFFQSFAVVVTAGVITSLYISLTLVPMLCAKGLKRTSKKSILTVFELIFRPMNTGYVYLLRLALRFRWVMVGLAMVLFAGSIPIFMGIGKGFWPQSQGNGHFSVMLRTPAVSSHDYTTKKMMQVVTYLKTLKEIKHYYATLDTANQAYFGIQLKKQHLNQKTEQRIREVIYSYISAMAGVMVSTTGSSHEQLKFYLKGNNYEALKKEAKQFYQKLKENKDLGHIKLDLHDDKPQYQLKVDRILASQVSVSLKQLADALKVLVGGMNVGSFVNEADQNRYLLYMQADVNSLGSASDFSNIYVVNNKDDLVRLDSIASISTSLSPSRISRSNLRYAVAFSTTPHTHLQTALTEIKSLAKEYLPPNVDLVFSGNAQAFQQTITAVGTTFLFILVLLYMVLASQFNSFIQPLIVMVAQPLAMFGGLLALYVTGQTLNIYSVIGLLLLMGLVAKNSILLIDLTNRHRKEGKSIKEALSLACPVRLRPVLMTSLTIIVAMLPALIFSTPDSDTERPLASVIVGGMLFSTLLTLIIIPAVYSLVENGLLRIRTKHTPRG